MPIGGLPSAAMVMIVRSIQRTPTLFTVNRKQGFLQRFDRKTGESVSIRPQPEKGEEDLRFNWGRSDSHQPALQYPALFCQSKTPSQR